jgi:hypothetical protein
MKAKVSYSELLKDPRWQRKKTEILQRDGFKCKLCGDGETTLHVHHKRYKNGRSPWQYKDEELITLCECCHKFIENTKNISGLNSCSEIYGKCLKSRNPELRIKLYNYLDLSQIYVFNKANAVVKVANLIRT